jgi:Leucine-rich repeat (LRR) protein
MSVSLRSCGLEALERSHVQHVGPTLCVLSIVYRQRVLREAQAHLRVLDLSDNKLTDIGAIGDLTTLRELNASQNKLSSLEFVQRYSAARKHTRHA